MATTVDNSAVMVLQDQWGLDPVLRNRKQPKVGGQHKEESPWGPKMEAAGLRL
jgi:hypothetical protein